MVSEFIRHEATGLWARPGTKDEMILDEVLVEKTYGMAPLTTSDVVLDIGGNIGASARFFVDRGVSWVISFEPDLDNAEVFDRNMGPDIVNGMVSLQRAAIARESGQVTLYTNNGPNKACHSLVEKRGYSATTVDGISFKKVLDHYDPTVIKCDIEGGEYGLPWELLESRPRVRVVIIELHTQKPEWRTQHAPALMALMSVLGFNQVTNVSSDFKSSWPKRVIWERRVASYVR